MLEVISNNKRDKTLTNFYDGFKAIEGEKLNFIRR